MSFLRIGLVLLAAAGVAAPTGAADAPRAVIMDFEVQGREDRLDVSFRVDNALTQDERERIGSGIPVTFRHRVELLARRAVPLLPARVLGRTVVETTARYDSLTRRYLLARRNERKTGDGKPEIVESARSVDSLDEVEAFMSILRDVALPVPPPELRDRRLRVRVESVLGRRYRLLIFPGSRTASAEQRLLPWP